MAWVTPTTKATGTKITEAIWEQDVKDNTIFLHTRVYYETLAMNNFADTPVEVGGTNASLYGIDRDAAAEKVRWTWTVPDNFSALSSAVIVVSPEANDGDFQYDLLTDYAGDGQVVTTHNESSLNQTVALTTDTLEYIDFSGVLTGIAAGDTVGIMINYDSYSGANPSVFVISAMVGYTKT